MNTLSSLLKFVGENISSKQYVLINDTYRAGPIVFTKVGSIVLFNSNSDFKTLSQGGWTELGTIPAEFRPTTTIQVRVSNNANLVRIQVETNGKVSAYNNGPAITTNTNGAFNGAYATP